MKKILFLAFFCLPACTGGIVYDLFGNKTNGATVEIYTCDKKMVTTTSTMVEPTSGVSVDGAFAFNPYSLDGKTFDTTKVIPKGKDYLVIAKGATLGQELAEIHRADFKTDCNVMSEGELKPVKCNMLNLNLKNVTNRASYIENATALSDFMSTCPVVSYDLSVAACDMSYGDSLRACNREPTPNCKLIASQIHAQCRLMAALKP